MRILHVLADMRKAAGTSVFCGEVCRELVRLGHEVVLALPDPGAPGLYEIDPAVQVIPMRSVAGQFDICHIHAIWSPVLHRVCRWARAEHIPIIWSPHGMLTKWAMWHRWWKKWPVWYLWQKRDLQYADVVHVTTAYEEMDVRRVGLQNKVSILPLGIHVDEYSTTHIPSKQMKVVLFVGRIHPIKGLEVLIRSFAAIRDPDWRLLIVGPDQDGYASSLRRLAKEAEAESRIEFCGPCYGRDLKRMYSSSDLFVLPSHSENFASVVIEALASGLPVIATRGTPWAELESSHCGRWVDDEVPAMTAALAEFMRMSDSERLAMGISGRKLVEEKYDWKSIVLGLQKIYNETIRGSKS